MKAWRLAFTAAVAGLAGCGYATQTVTAADTEMSAERRGMFGDLTWTRDSSGKWERVKPEPSAAAAPTSASEQEEFKKWQESAGSKERQEFEEWRAWQEWKRKNPK
jgi:hypothetical protein